ncbi:MAG: hypothetical protein AW06_003603 [Candidatus Accumulibacter cognatus]|uniref:Uncharacterized protein n=1 Tax=Candidatus Accumulibacter cognatus TaxID=2954383 RepID=A0A080MDP7_9PROT|nr:MAG: hypothetical protein AW06_003603 [Candidatus Accumulibacter cognatus]
MTALATLSGRSCLSNPWTSQGAKQDLSFLEFVSAIR